MTAQTHPGRLLGILRHRPRAELEPGTRRPVPTTPRRPAVSVIRNLPGTTMGGWQPRCTRPDCWESSGIAPAPPRLTQNAGIPTHRKKSRKVIIG